MSKKVSMENPEDEEIDGDGVVTMKTGNMAVRPGKACIPLVTHQQSWEIDLGDRGVYVRFLSKYLRGVGDYSNSNLKGGLLGLTLT